jgi:uncharacterized membrane protein
MNVTPALCVSGLGIGFVATSSAMAGGFEPYWHFSGVFHPAVAHFPIALLIVAAIIELFRLRSGKPTPSNASYICLIIGAAFAVLATIFGWANAAASGSFNGTLEQVATLHRWLGLAVAIVAVLLTGLATFMRRGHRSAESNAQINKETAANSGSSPGPALTWVYRLGLAAVAVMVALVGSFGGKLTHGVDYYADAYDQMQRQLQEPANIDSTEIAGANPKPQQINVGKPPIKPPIVAAQPKAPNNDPPPVIEVAGAVSPNNTLGAINYHKDILPIFAKHCFKCHDAKKHKGGYRLDTKAFAFKPGESEEAPIVPNKADDSLLIKVVEGKGEYEDSTMPPKGALLNTTQIALIRKWIDQGAVWSEDGS